MRRHSARTRTDHGEEDLVAEYATEQGGIAPDVIKKAFSATEEKYFQFVKHQLLVRPQIASIISPSLGLVQDLHHSPSIGLAQ
ncbi:hypothetical protein Tco_0109020 [Tanacetum coccineum]